jgi:hypothetical protein
MRGIFAFLWLALGAASSLAAGLVDFNSKTHVTTKSRIWTEPSRFGEAIAALEPGLELEVIEANTSQSWVKVRTPSGREGWMPARHTALWGRRAEPLVPGEEGSSRRPASMGSAQPVAAAPKETAQLAFGLLYANQINRSATHGFGAEAGVEFDVESQFSVGFGLDYGFFGESARSSDGQIDTRRVTQRFVPQARATWNADAFALIVGLGWELERTSFETTDLTTGDKLLTDPDTGLKVSGSEWTHGLAFKLQPSFSISSDERSKFYVFASYALNVQLQGSEGEFLGTPTSALTHMVGLGLGFRSRF